MKEVTIGKTIKITRVLMGNSLILNCLEEMENNSETNILYRLHQKEVDNLNRPITK